MGFIPGIGNEFPSSAVYSFPEDYGALGDGTTDDTAAMRSWLNDTDKTYKSLTDGKTYLVSDTSSAAYVLALDPDVHNNMIITGTKHSTIKLGAGHATETNIIGIDETVDGTFDSLVIGGFTVDGNKDNQTMTGGSGMKFFQTPSQGDHEITILETWVKNCVEHGVSSGVKTLNFDRINAYSCGSIGFVQRQENATGTALVTGNMVFAKDCDQALDLSGGSFSNNGITNNAIGAVYAESCGSVFKIAGEHFGGIDLVVAEGSTNSSPTQIYSNYDTGSPFVLGTVVLKNGAAGSLYINHDIQMEIGQLIAIGNNTSGNSNGEILVNKGALTIGVLRAVNADNYPTTDEECINVISSSNAVNLNIGVEYIYGYGGASKHCIDLNLHADSVVNIKGGVIENTANATNSICEVSGGGQVTIASQLVCAKAIEIVSGFTGGLDYSGCVFDHDITTPVNDGSKTITASRDSATQDGYHPFVEVDSTSAVTYTVVEDSLPINRETKVVQKNTGSATIAAGTGVTLTNAGAVSAQNDYATIIMDTGTTGRVFR